MNALSSAAINQQPPRVSQKKPAHNAQNYTVTYGVDLVLCIDATGSMKPVIDSVKQSALEFHEKLTQKMQTSAKNVDQLRVQVIIYRDYWADEAEDAMVCSIFFELPKQNSEFSAFIGAIEAHGGGDEPESGLEALALAMQSDWDESHTKHRHVIVVWTDTDTHDLEREDKPAHYPPVMAKDFNELYEWWGEMPDEQSKRIVLFAPECQPWTDIAEWDQVTHFPTSAGQGLGDLTMEEILEDIVNSIA